MPLSDTMFVVAHFHMVMGVSPIMVIFGAIYHWYPKITGRMLNEALGQFHFWVTFLGAYAIFLPMHYVGPGRRAAPLSRARRRGVHHRTPSDGLNAFISIAALIVGFAQMVFLFNLIWSLRHGREAGGNPWRATTLEWQTPETPPAHGNWGKELPVVYRWAYDYSVPGAPQDFIAQNDPGPPRHRDEAGMSVILVFILVVLGVAGWWLAQQRHPVQAVARGRAGRHRHGRRDRCRPPKIALVVFLAVVGCLFALFASAYFMRMELPDWRPMPVPALLWVNTGLLVLSSVELQCAVIAARTRRDRRRCASALSPAGSPPSRSSPGSCWPGASWSASGYFARVQPVRRLLLPAHRRARAAHPRRPGRARPDRVGRLGRREPRPASPQRRAVRHLLAFPALRLDRASFVLLAGWANDFIEICRQAADLNKSEGGADGRDHTDATPEARPGGLRGLRRRLVVGPAAFKSASWGKAMMWIFLLSDTFIFCCFLSPT